jgi:hypothetical protein
MLVWVLPVLALRPALSSAAPPPNAVEGDFLACGSETNEVYVYYKALSKPVAHQALAARALGEGPAAMGSSELSPAAAATPAWGPVLLCTLRG